MIELTGQVASKSEIDQSARKQVAEIENELGMTGQDSSDLALNTPAMPAINSDFAS